MRLRINCALVSLALLAMTAPAAAVVGVWSTEFHTSGPNAKVECLLRWNGEVYAGGDFTAIGQTAVTSGVARARDGIWEPVGGALAANGVIDLCIHDGALHALGRLNSGRRVWRLDGEAWIPVGPELAGYETAIASYLGDLYQGGHRLEDGDWVDRLEAAGRIESLVVHDGLLVAGGEFATAGGIATGRVCAWDGAAVIDAFPGQDVIVRNLESWNGALYASRYSGGGPITGVQVWADGAWTDIPELGDVTFTDVITDLAAGEGRLLVTSYSFQIIVKDAGTRGSSLRAWDGATVETLFTPPSNLRFLTTAEAEDGVWLGGTFTLVGGAFTANLGLIRSGTMEPVCDPGLGADGTVAHFETSDFGFGLAIGGFFSHVGRQQSRGVALHDAGTWESRGFEHWVDPSWYYGPLQIAWDGDLLYTYASGHANEAVGRWFVGGWEFGDWISRQPADLVAWEGQAIGPSGDAIYSYFVHGDPVPVASVTGAAAVMSIFMGDLIVGGEFTAIDGTPARNIAVAEGDGWAPLGAGLPERVVALGRYRGELVAVVEGPGGQTDANDVFTWDGNIWEYLVSLAGGPVRCVQDYSGCLFFGGRMDMVDAHGAPMRGIACWDGTQWDSVGDTPGTLAMAVHDGKLWVGGGFLHAGGVPASRLTFFSTELTQVEDGPPPAVLALHAPAPNPFNPRTALQFDLPRAAVARLEVYDAAGRRIAVVLDEWRAAGRHLVMWSGAGDDGRALASGTYLVRLRAGEVTATTKAMLVH